MSRWSWSVTGSRPSARRLQRRRLDLLGGADRAARGPRRHRHARGGRAHGVEAARPPPAGARALPRGGLGRRARACGADVPSRSSCLGRHRTERPAADLVREARRASSRSTSNQIRGQHGSRYADLTQDPAFAFGEGLSYTSVEYSELQLDRGERAQVPGLARWSAATVTVRNAGHRPAHEVVQVYVRDLVDLGELGGSGAQGVPARGAAHPAETVDGGAGVSRPAACTIVDAEGRRVVELGDFDLLVGPSSRESRYCSPRGSPWRG